MSEMTTVLPRLRFARRPDAEAGVSLRKRRAWFVDGDGSEGGGQPDGQKPNDDGDGNIPEDVAALAESIKKDPVSAALKMKEQREEAKRYRLAKDAAETAKTEQERKRLADEKKYAELATSLETELNGLKPLKTQYEAVSAYLTESVAARIKAIPEGMRSIVPEFADPLQTLKWLDKNATILRAPIAPNLEAGAGGGSGATAATLTQAQLQRAQQLGVTPEDYAKQLTSK